LAKTLVKSIKQSVAAKANDKRIQALIQDAEGQVLEALSKQEFFSKWGQHYLPSLARAHLLQQCNNFKDPGVQVYGGELFKKLRDAADEAFCKLPPPQAASTSKAYASNAYGSSKAPRAAKTNISMKSYYNSSNPCFHGHALVTLSDGHTKLCQDITQGDVIKTPNGMAQVKCVVKTLCFQGRSWLVKLEGGLLVTPYHPIRFSSSSDWQFPCDVAPVHEMDCEAVYSYVLESISSSTVEPVMIINGVQCVTLGHRLQSDAVVTHPYFGSDRVLNDLAQIKGYASGLVQLGSVSNAKGVLIRDPLTCLVTGLEH